MSTIFLFQTLLRDLWILAVQTSRNTGTATRTKSAFCVESVVGVSAVAVGCGLLFVPLSTRINLGNAGWSISILLTMLLCFVLRDFVFQWRPWRIYREPDHVNIMVRW
jgi:membrane protein YdbS with pleckstrin-like domain